MTKLLCTRHQRRVYVLDLVTVHREDGTPCDSTSLVSGDRVRSPEQVRDESQRREEAADRAKP